METGILISIGALIVAALGLILNAKKETKADAAALSEIKAGLNTANSGISDIRVDLRQLQGSINDHSERLARVESRVESNSHRLDILEKRKIKGGPGDGNGKPGAAAEKSQAEEDRKRAVKGRFQNGARGRTTVGRSAGGIRRKRTRRRAGGKEPPAGQGTDRHAAEDDQIPQGEQQRGEDGGTGKEEREAGGEGEMGT